MRVLFLSILLLAAVALCAQDSLSTYKPGDNMLFVCPTAETLPRGAGCFGSYELFFIDFSMSFVDNFEIGAFSLFPIVTQAVEYAMVHAKFRYFKSDDISSAAYVASIPKASFNMIGNAFSYRSDQWGMHFSPALAINEDNDTEVVFMGGVSLKSGENSQFMADFFTTATTLEDDVSGIMFIGWRWRGEMVAWDFGGVRPILEDTGDFLFFPYVKASWTWGL